MSGYVKDCTQAIVEAMTAGGFVKAEKGALTFGYREPLVASFAFVLHSEFPDPDMHHIDRLYESRGLRSMLWNPERYLSTLYELRNRGLLSKVSEIDRFRQFTTQWTPAGLVDRLEAPR
jgi:DNA repair protein RadC